MHYRILELLRWIILLVSFSSQSKIKDKTKQKGRHQVTWLPQFLQKWGLFCWSATFCRYRGRQVRAPPIASSCQYTLLCQDERSQYLLVCLPPFLIGVGEKHHVTNTPFTFPWLIMLRCLQRGGPLDRFTLPMWMVLGPSWTGASSPQPHCIRRCYLWYISTGCIT